MVLVAGGIGITPMAPILTLVLDPPRRGRLLPALKSLTLVWSIQARVRVRASRARVRKHGGGGGGGRWGRGEVGEGVTGGGGEAGSAREGAGVDGSRRMRQQRPQRNADRRLWTDRRGGPPAIIEGSPMPTLRAHLSRTSPP